MTRAFLFTLILSFALSFELQAYVQGRGVNGSVVHWTSNVTQIQLYVKTDNRRGVSAATVFSIVQAAAQEWNAVSPIQILPVLNQGSPVKGGANLYFSSGASAIFSGMGGGVLGVTQTLYSADGAIVGGDVVINDSVTLEVVDTNSDNYLGNIITHELGHLLGLSHTEVKGATMIYTALRGQKTIESDDKAGIYSLYAPGAKGKISGKIVGGDGLIGVLGAHVQVISRKNGKVVAGVYSEIDGTFAVEGLEYSDSYYLYISPASMLAQVPDYYSEAKKNFCSSGAAYRGSFFESCDSSMSGFPQEIALTSSNSSLDVGLITIRCDLSSPADYLSYTKKLMTDTATLTFVEEGKTFAGFFTPAEIAGGSSDVFNIDLRAHAVSGTEYLDLKILSQAFYARHVFKVQVKRLTDGTLYNYTPGLDADGSVNADYLARVPLSAVAAQNNFEVTLSSVSPDYDGAGREIWNWGSGYNYLSSLFPNYSVMKEELRFYLFMYTLSRPNGDGTYSLLSPVQTQTYDNAACPDGPRTYKVAATTDDDAFSSKRRSQKLDQGTPLACGTIGSSGGNGGSGPLMLTLGLLLACILRFLPSTKMPWIPARPIS